MDKKYAKKLFLTAREYCEEHQLDELEWAEGVSEDTFKNIKSKKFLRHYCWAVYASGFSFETVNSKFPALETAFKDFDITALSKMRSTKPILKVFGNKRKADCFLKGAKMIADEGFGTYKKRLKKGGIDALEELPGIGPITKFHLAKNIGLADAAKPDRWLERAARKCKAASVDELVNYLSKKSDSSRHVVDVVLWRYGVDKRLAMDDDDDDVSPMPA